MIQLAAAEIRDRFVTFYTKMGYRLLPRAPLLDPSIPMSFVMSAGLVQVENSLASLAASQGRQFVLVQECFRHFDLERVGSDDIHLSFFEMPGAFVFEPPAKKVAIGRMAALAVEQLGIDGERLWATYFRGDLLFGERLPPDEETHRAWLEIGFPDSRVVGLGLKENFWVQGEGNANGEMVRKCGPNTELFFDRRPDRPCGPGCRPGCRCGRFVEFSNSLFINYWLADNNRRTIPLARPFAETVIGLERAAMILQGAPNVFEIDTIRPLLAAINRYAWPDGCSEAQIRRSRHILADHLRALYRLAADGAPQPGKDGRARIIKLLVRGALTHQRLLGIHSPAFLRAALGCAAAQNGAGSSHIAAVEQVCGYFASETQRFERTLARSLGRLETILKENSGRPLSGEQALNLVKGWGLPLPLAEARLRQHGLAFPEQEYQNALEVFRLKK